MTSNVKNTPNYDLVAAAVRYLYHEIRKTSS